MRESLLMLLLALSLLGCASEGKVVRYGEARLTTNVERNLTQMNNVVLGVGDEIRQGKPGATYVLKWELRTEP